MSKVSDDEQSLLDTGWVKRGFTLWQHEYYKRDHNHTVYTLEDALVENEKSSDGIYNNFPTRIQLLEQIEELREANVILQANENSNA